MLFCLTRLPFLLTSEWPNLAHSLWPSLNAVFFFFLLNIWIHLSHFLCLPPRSCHKHDPESYVESCFSSFLKNSVTESICIPKMSILIALNFTKIYLDIYNLLDLLFPINIILLRFIHIVCFSYLLLCDKLPPNVVASKWHTFLISQFLGHSLARSFILASLMKTQSRCCLRLQSSQGSTGADPLPNSFSGCWQS